MRTRLPMILALIMLFSGMCVMEKSAVGSRPIEHGTNAGSSVYVLAGEFRTVFANLLWIKVDQYHHEYLERHPDWTQDKDLLSLLNLITTGPTLRGSLRLRNLHLYQWLPRQQKGAQLSAAGCGEQPTLLGTAQDVRNHLREPFPRPP